MKPLLILILILILPFLSSCILLVPHAFHPELNNQRAAIAESDSITVYLEHIGVKYGHLIMDLDVINHSCDTLSLSPWEVFFYASNQPFALITSTSQDVDDVSAPNSLLVPQKYFAKGPAEVEHMYEKRMQTKATIGAVFTLLSVGIAVYDIAKDAEDNRKESWTKKDAQNAIARDALIATTRITGDALIHSVQRDGEDYSYLSHELFPYSQIEPDKRVRGKLFLPETNMFNYYRVVVPINGNNFVFDFRRRGSKR